MPRSIDLDTLRRRAAYLARRNEHGRVYLAVDPALTRNPAWPRVLQRVRRALQPAHVQTFDRVWRGARASARYHATWEHYADTLTGLVVVVGPEGVVGSGAVKEIASVWARHLPVIAVTAHGGRFAPLNRCETNWLVDGQRHMLRVDVPPDVDQRVLRVYLAAMGARRKPHPDPKPLFVPPGREGGQPAPTVGRDR